MGGITHFLIIAVEKYNNKSFSKVAFAQKDAKDIAAAFQALGHDPGNFIELINSHATKTAVEYNLKSISLKAQEQDRIIIYFAGHGFSMNGDNLITPVDARIDGLEETCVSINTILGWLKKAKSKRNILFLDCCHSGFEPGEYLRDVTGDFLSEDLIYSLKDEVYCVGFASCQTHQKSNSHPKLENGVWSHYLIQTLSGNAEDETVYESGILTSDKLQSYLRNKTYEFVKKHTDDRRDQVPIQFGNFSDKFVVEDINPIFEAREAEKRASSVNLTSISIYDTEDGSVKELPGFKRHHHAPDKFGSVFDNFIKDISGDLVKEEIEAMSQEIKEKLEYTRKQVQVEINKGYGSIETPDFSYSIEVSQSQENPKEYIIKRSLDTIVNEDIVHNDRFNSVFDKHFRQLSFHFDKKINIDDFIDRVEPIAKKRNFQLKYNPANTSTCKIIFPDSVNEIVITGHSINITIPRAASPAKLIETYKETALQLESAKLNLLT